MKWKASVIYNVLLLFSVYSILQQTFFSTVTRALSFVYFFILFYFFFFLRSFLFMVIYLHAVAV